MFNFREPTELFLYINFKYLKNITNLDAELLKIPTVFLSYLLKIMAKFSI